jgi:hypothetical protein
LIISFLHNEGVGQHQIQARGETLFWMIVTVIIRFDMVSSTVCCGEGI